MSFGSFIGLLSHIISVCRKGRLQPRRLSVPRDSAAKQCGIGFSDLAVASVVVDQTLSTSRRGAMLFSKFGPIVSGNRPSIGCQFEGFATDGLSRLPHTSRDPVNGFLCQSVGNASRLSKSAVRWAFVR